MSPKTFIAFSVAAVIAVVAAGISVALQPGTGQPEGAGRLLFAGLLGRVNDVASVVVEERGGKLTLRRDKDGWVLQESDGYPARADKVGAAILGLARLTLVEPKTRRKDRYEKLYLRDLDADGALSKLVTLADAAGKPLARVLVGRHNYTFQSDGGGALYVRKPGDAQAWLARGTLDIGTEPRDWLRRAITDIKPERIARVVVRHPDGETVTASKTAPGDKHFTVAPLPAGARLKNAFVADDFGQALENLELTDARKADAVAFPADATVRAEVSTFDGLTVRVTLAEVKGKNWMRLSFAASPAAQKSAEAKKSDTGKEAAKEPAKEAGKNGSKDTAKKKPGDVAREAEELARRTKGWVYRVTEYKAGQLTKRIADLIEEPKPKS